MTIHATGVLFKTTQTTAKFSDSMRSNTALQLSSDNVTVCSEIAQCVAKCLSFLSLLQAPLVEAKTKSKLVRRVNSAVVNGCGVFFVLPWYV